MDMLEDRVLLNMLLYSIAEDTERERIEKNLLLGYVMFKQENQVLYEDIN